jgi:dihydrofolate reductase
MLDLGIVPWGGNPTFHMPVYVVTNRSHEPIVKAGGTTYYFVTEGLHRALEQARAAASDKDIVIAGGANIVQQCLAAGVVDEIRLHLVPVLLGAGIRLFDHLDHLDHLDAKTVSSQLDPSGVVHLRFRIRRG